MASDVDNTSALSTRYVEFGRLAFECVKECIAEGCFECDAETLADIAVKAGLMVHEPYDPAKHNMEFMDHDYEPGDIIYYWGDGVTFRNLTVDELREEVLKLQTLAVAVGQCSPSDVPESVMKAWKEPRNYRDDELHWLREKYLHLLEAAARVIRHHDQGTLARAKSDSNCIELLRLQITGSSR